MAADRFNVNLSISRNWDHLQIKHVGTGQPKQQKYSWGTQIQRDTLASHLGHQDQLIYFATAENESIGRIRFDILEKMRNPCHTTTTSMNTNTNPVNNTNEQQQQQQHQQQSMIIKNNLN